jgi:simple sugar transport system ATP-binding protein
MLIPVMTVLDNIILGYETGSFKLDRRKSREELEPLFARLGLPTNLFETRIADLSVGVQQKIEIIKALYRNAQLIIFDEPTAVLTPQETQELFSMVRRLKEDGKSIIFISHKLNEIMEISDDISVMRNGKLVGSVEKSEITQDDLARMMIGRDLVEQIIDYRENSNGSVLAVDGVHTEIRLGSSGLKGLTFSVKKGEIFGIAGVAGNGQNELVSILVGTERPVRGKVHIDGRDVTGIPAHKRTDSLSYIPEDRQVEGLVMPFTVSENLVLGKVDQSVFTHGRILLDFESIRKTAEQAIDDYSIKVSRGPLDTLESLSGGNQQKVIVARELAKNSDVILAVNPARGIDIGSIEYIHSCLIAERDRGRTVLLVSNELSEIMALSDRIGVIHDGQIVKVFSNTNLPKEELGYYMLGGRDESEKEVV